MSAPSIEGEIRELRETAHVLLPARDFTKPGPHRMSFEDAANKIKVEYSDALELLGKL